MTTKTKRTQAKPRGKSYMRKIDPTIHMHKIWNGRAIVPESKETVILWGEATDPTLAESARIIRNGGRTVQFKNLTNQAI